MTENQQPPSDRNAREMLGPGIAFLGCGVAFLAVGVATKQYVFAMTAPAFIALGIVFIVRARRRPGDRDPH